MITHLEDLIFQGKSNVVVAILKEFVGHFTTGVSNLNITTKWDGAPAIVCGTDQNNRFFVGTKSIFNKVSKVCYTENDIWHHYGSSGQNKVLYNKLVTCLTYLPELNIKGILQGDMMYDRLHNELTTDTKYLKFKPNVVEYKVPLDSTLTEHILRSKLGIVFHTAWNQNLTEASYKIDIGSLTPSDNVWFRDASLVNAIGPQVFFEGPYYDNYSYLLDSLNTTLKRVPKSVSNYFIVNETMKSLTSRYINDTIREGKMTFDYNTFLLYVYDYLVVNINEAKKPETKVNRTKIKEEIMKWFGKNQEYIRALFEGYSLVIAAKDMVINKLNQMKDIETTNSLTEGYVVSYDKEVVKLIDRPKFSYENFHMQRDWQ